MKCSELLDSSNRANENLRFFYSLIHWIILIKHKIMESLDFFCKDSFEDPSWGSLYTSVVPSITSWSVPYCYVFIEIKVSTQNCFWIRLLRLLQVTLHNVEWSKLKLSYLITLCEYRLGSYLRLRCRVKDEDVSKLISKQKKRESPFAVSEKPRFDKYYFFFSERIFWYVDLNCEIFPRMSQPPHYCLLGRLLFEWLIYVEINYQTNLIGSNQSIDFHFWTTEPARRSLPD